VPVHFLQVRFKKDMNVINLIKKWQSFGNKSVLHSKKQNNKQWLVHSHSFESISKVWLKKETIGQCSLRNRNKRKILRFCRVKTKKSETYFAYAFWWFVFLLCVEFVSFGVILHQNTCEERRESCSERTAVSNRILQHLSKKTIQQIYPLSFNILNQKKHMYSLYVKYIYIKNTTLHTHNERRGRERERMCIYHCSLIFW
jgi:hypothetical protein